MMRFDTFLPRKVTRTPEGFFDIVGTAAVVGLLRYDTGVEFVGSDALRASVSSLKDAPVTSEHPPSMLTPDNTSDHKVGHVSDAWFDEESQELQVKIRVDTKKGIDGVLARETVQLSPGYIVTGFGPAGENQYGRFDAEQKSRQVNHLALTKAARAGEVASLKLDTQDSKMDKEELQAMVDALTAERNDAQAQVLKLTAELDVIKTDSTAEPAPVVDDFYPRFVEHQKALEVAGKLGIEVKADSATSDIRLACVEKHLGKSDKMDSDVYVQAAFDLLFTHTQRTDSQGSNLFAAVREGKRVDSDDKYTIEGELVDPTKSLATKFGHKD